MSFSENKYKYLNITPRTHISIETSKNDFSQNVNLVKVNKVDQIDEGINKLIYLGKIIKNYFPHKDYFKKKFNMKTFSQNKLTPFQIYLRNKKIISEKLNSKKNFEPELKSVKSEKTYKSKSSIKNILNNKKKKKLNMPMLYNNTTECYFKNKFIKSVFEQNNKNKNRKNNSQYKTLTLTESNFNSFDKRKSKNNIADLINSKYLLSISNFSRNKTKKLTNDFRYEKDKMLLLNKQKSLKKKKNINLFNEIKSFQENINAKTITEENYKDNYHQIPLIDLSNLDKKNNQFYNLFIRNNLKNYISNRNKK